MVAELEAQKFRCVSHIRFTPNTGLNLIIGPNAQGKTSLLEAISLLSTGRSVRPGKECDAITHSADEALVRASLDTGQTELAVRLTRPRGKVITINGLTARRGSDLLGRLPCTTFWAPDLAIAFGEPTDRRLFLDGELSQISPSYLRQLTIYKRALQQRNAILRSFTVTLDREALLPWEMQMCQAAIIIERYRRDWVEALSPLAGRIHSGLCSAEALTISYRSSTSPQALEEALDRAWPTDRQRKVTTVGPHRDDLDITISGHSTRLYSSQGQQRSAVIAIKLAVLELAAERLGRRPVCLLDDIFSDLDAVRRSNLVEQSLTLGGQVFMTSTDDGQVSRKLLESAKIIRVREGSLIE